MEDCKINDAGAVALAEAIKLNESLTKLSIFSNDDISEQGKFSLVAALNVNVSITEYDGYWLNCLSAELSFSFLCLVNRVFLCLVYVFLSDLATISWPLPSSVPKIAPSISPHVRRMCPSCCILSVSGMHLAE